MFKIQLLLFISSICIAGKELEEARSEFHARVDFLNLKCVSFSNSEEDTVNLEHGILKRNAKKRLKSICQNLSVWKKAVWDLK